MIYSIIHSESDYISFDAFVRGYCHTKLRLLNTEKLERGKQISANLQSMIYEYYLIKSCPISELSEVFNLCEQACSKAIMRQFDIRYGFIYKDKDGS